MTVTEYEDVGAAERTSRKHGRRNWTSAVYGIAGVIIILVLWQLVTTLFKIPPYLMVGPWSVVKRVADQGSYFWGASVATLWESLLGFISGTIFGIVAAIAIHYSRTLRALFYPAVMAINTIPKVAVAPLLVVWFGFGYPSKVIVSLLIAFFPVLVSTADGLRSVPDELHELAAIERATPVRRFWKIDFVYSLPVLFTGMKLSVTSAVGGAVVGEFISGNIGLGYIINQGTALLDVSSMFASFVLLSLMAMLLFLLIDLIGYFLLPWARTSR
jgi:NitT/TauT family transport system permease protein